VVLRLRRSDPLAFNNDFTHYTGRRRDRPARHRDTGDVVAGSDRPFVVTPVLPGSHLPHLDRGRRGRPIPRAARSARRLSSPSRGVRVSVLRLPPSVHGEGDRGFVRG